jgi:hypothetical protein
MMKTGIREVDDILQLKEQWKDAVNLDNIKKLCDNGTQQEVNLFGKDDVIWNALVHLAHHIALCRKQKEG